jgi:hypothetical protein
MFMRTTIRLGTWAAWTDDRLVMPMSCGEGDTGWRTQGRQNVSLAIGLLDSVRMARKWAAGGPGGLGAGGGVSERVGMRDDIGVDVEDMSAAG